MQFSLLQQIRTSEVVALFKDVFSASEGDAEGQLIADFVAKLIATTDPIDLICCVAEKNDTIVGCIFFSRFTVPNEQSAFILSPVAVSTDVQGQGIGQQLIQYGLAHLKAMHIDLVFTYGDPNYYSKTGFYQINEDIVKAPCPLSEPIGWLAQSLDGQMIEPIVGATGCVDALNDPELW